MIADPDFDLSIGVTAQIEAPEDGSRISDSAAENDLANELLRSTAPDAEREMYHGLLEFPRLSGTQTEGQSIAGTLGAHLWMGADALEQKVKACRSPSILHFATHGYFLPEELDVAQTGAESKTLSQRFAIGRISAAGNPLLRSGLALAGANTWLEGGMLPAEAQDGLLTAEDVTGLDLLGTELVVLSACETGLGDIRVGEGVLGLRRAFVLAGARTLVMSLWKVTDEQTADLMKEFYRRLLAGEHRFEALRGAQLAIRNIYPDPAYWGAFICQGDFSPLFRTIATWPN